MIRPRAAFDGFLEAALQIRPGEGRRTALLFLHLFLASAVFFLGRTVRDTLFLSRYSLAALPWMFVVYGVASAATVVLYAQVADRMARQRLIALTAAIGIATYLATWGVVRAGASWIYPAFYVWADIVANLFIVQFWTLANDLHDARSAKRLFGAIGAARLLASVVVGLGTGVVVRAVGTAQLLFVLAALMLGFGLLAFPLANEPRAERGARAGEQPRRRGAPPRVLRRSLRPRALGDPAGGVHRAHHRRLPVQGDRPRDVPGGRAWRSSSPSSTRARGCCRSCSSSSSRRGSSRGSASAGAWRRCRRCSARGRRRCWAGRRSASRR